MVLVAYYVFFYYAITDTFRKYKEKFTSQNPAIVEAKVSIWFVHPAYSAVFVPWLHYTAQIYHVY